jgi:hypothetical protein
LFLLATVTYTFGNGLVQSILSTPDDLLQVSVNRTQVVSGVLLEFVAAVANVAIGVLLFPILKKHSERVALGYLATRIFDGAGLVVGGSGILGLIALSWETIQAGTHQAAASVTLGNLLIAGSDMAFVVTMLGLGLGAMPFTYLLYRSQLIPRPLAVLGMISYASLFIGSVFELFGLNLNMLHFVPGALFEFLLPLWLFVKGFNLSTVASNAATSERSERHSRLSAT